jgi:DNA-binding protein H-NS
LRGVSFEDRWKSKMDFDRLNEMSLDELWRLHEAIVVELSRKMTAEKAKLEERLSKLDPNALGHGTRRPKHRFPK